MDDSYYLLSRFPSTLDRETAHGLHLMENKGEQYMYIITGMHRSGTSLIARLFFEAGADMGDPGTFYRPDRWNPEGYYEQPDIHAINMPLINGPWGKFAYFRLPSTRTILKRAEKRAEQIRRTAEAYKGKVIKETRYCLTLPAWLKYGAEVSKILICLRDPIQVARSIQKRNFAPLRHSYYMWYLHNKRILHHAGNIPIWIVYYNNALDEDTYSQEVGKALCFFGFDLNMTDLAELRKKAVRTHMNHNPEQVEMYPPKIQELWNALRQRHADQFA
jgi:hypothetical protein